MDALVMCVVLESLLKKLLPFFCGTLQGYDGEYGHYETGVYEVFGSWFSWVLIRMVVMWLTLPSATLPLAFPKAIKSVLLFLTHPSLRSRVEVIVMSFLFQKLVLPPKKCGFNKFGASCLSSSPFCTCQDSRLCLGLKRRSCELALRGRNCLWNYKDVHRQGRLLFHLG